jgi:hypothetical protein
MNHSNHSILIRGGIAFDKRPKAYVQDTIPSIRRWFDGQIVVSTWKGQEHLLKGLENHIDHVVLSDDPGPGFIQSYNRQLISYESGLSACSGELVLVCRADFDIRSDLFEYWKSVPKKNNGVMQVFEERVIAGNMMTITPNKAEASVSHFRVSDWIQLGKKTDLQKWSSVLEVSKELYRSAKGTDDISTDEYKTEQYGTEQVWFISLLNKFASPKIDLTNYQQQADLAWHALLNNFWIMNTRSTLDAHNLNWDFQPEFHPWYTSEQEHKHLYEYVYGKD